MSKAKEINKEKEMTKELFAALAQLAEENCIPMESLVEKISQAILKAVRKEYDYCRKAGAIRSFVFVWTLFYFGGYVNGEKKQRKPRRKYRRSRL